MSQTSRSKKLAELEGHVQHPLHKSCMVSADILRGSGLLFCGVFYIFLFLFLFFLLEMLVDCFDIVWSLDVMDCIQRSTLSSMPRPTHGYKDNSCNCGTSQYLAGSACHRHCSTMSQEWRGSVCLLRQFRLEHFTSDARGLLNSSDLDRKMGRLSERSGNWLPACAQDHSPSRRLAACLCIRSPEQCFALRRSTDKCQRAFPWSGWVERQRSYHVWAHWLALYCIRC